MAWIERTDLQVPGSGGGGGETSGPKYVVGRYYDQRALAVALGTSQVPGLPNYCYFAPTCIYNTVNVDRVGVEIMAASTAAGTMRFGRYSISSNGLPGTLLSDYGTVGTGTTGVKEVTLAETWNAGWYYLAYAFDATSTSGLTIKYLGVNTTQYFMGTLTLGEAGRFGVLLRAATTGGALVVSPPVTDSGYTITVAGQPSPLIGYRVAA